MGYRSDVYIAVKKELEEELKTTIEKAKLSDWVKKVDTQDEDLVYYKGEGLKWYENFEEYITIDSWLEEKLEADAHEDESSVHSIAMGEDGATFFEKGQYYNVFWVESSVTIPTESKEQRVYFLSKEYVGLTDAEYVAKAEEEGTVYSLKGFQVAFNSEDFGDGYIRII